MTAFVDAEGQVFVVEDANARVQVFDEDGTFVRSFGGPAAADGHLDEPFGVARALDGTFLVTDAAARSSATTPPAPSSVRSSWTSTRSHTDSSRSA